MSYNIALINQADILSVNAENFENIALSVFHHQYRHNDIYGRYCRALHIDEAAVDRMDKIPFLPISFFKTHRVMTGDVPNAELIFESSGTTGETPSRHYIADAGMYEASLLQGFEQFYGDPGKYTILALLPSYLERKNASLVHMARVLMEKSNKPGNGFYINEWEKLRTVLQQLEHDGSKTLLLGVTFALLDFAAAYPMDLKNTIVMETGGMKGRREEWTRLQVHDYLKQQWQLSNVHSEYGMTELLSQAYARANGIFECTNTMNVFIRDINDPFDIRKQGTGALNIIDLANVNSCSFIATEDIGTISRDGTFEVSGRLDHSALRGCSLMVI